MRILVADDDDLAAAITSAILQDGGLEVVVVSDAAEALAMLSADPAFDAVVSDMHMPGSTGLALFHNLRTQGHNMPFILLSGDDPVALQQQESGLAACVAKDINLETSLMTAVADALLPAAKNRS